MNVTFADDFRGQPNQVYIAMCGEPADMIKRLEMVITDIRYHGKPIQGIGCGATSHIITPVWCGKDY